MERTFPNKAIMLAANVQGTLSWGATDFGPRFYESIIKKPVAARFTCTNTGTSSINVGMRYDTLTKSYLVAERQTLFVVPAGKSVEITPATKPALGFLNENITIIYLDLITASAATVTVSMILDDEPPTLTADPGELIGLDQRLNFDYILTGNSGSFVQVPGFSINNIYTVAAGKRALLDLLQIIIGVTPAYPDLVTVTARILLFTGSTIDKTFYSRIDRIYVVTAYENFQLPLNSGDIVQIVITNSDTTNRTVSYNYAIREVF